MRLDPLPMPVVARSVPRNSDHRKSQHRFTHGGFCGFLVCDYVAILQSRFPSCDSAIFIGGTYIFTQTRLQTARGLRFSQLGVIA